MIEKEGSELEITEVDSARKKFDLLFDQNRVTLSEEYAKLVRRQDLSSTRGHWQGTTYSETWLDLFEARALPARNFFRQRLSGQPLIDLGGGEGVMMNLATDFGVSEYINVDRGYGDLPLNPYEIGHSGQLNPSSITLDVHADMLDFVARLKDNAANFTINGIDNIIVNDSAYHRVLAQELIRATRPGGLIFGIHSNVLHEILRLIQEKNLPIRAVDLKQETGYRLIAPLGYDIFEKME